MGEIMRRCVAALQMVICVGIFGLSPVRASERAIWDYSGQYGPSLWGEISSDYTVCTSGQRQSPISIEQSFDTVLDAPKFDWRSAGWEVVNTGNLIALRAQDGGTTMLDGVGYRLREISLHRPSEHALGGKHFDMEMQFMHETREGQMLGISVFLSNGGTNAVFEQIIGNAPPSVEDDPIAIDELDLTALVTDASDQYRYMGSLTYPPCREGVTWVVLQDPLAVSNAAMLAFALLYDGNARPLQALNDRFVLTD